MVVTTPKFARKAHFILARLCAGVITIFPMAQHVPQAGMKIKGDFARPQLSLRQGARLLTILRRRSCQRHCERKRSLYIPCWQMDLKTKQELGSSLRCNACYAGALVYLSLASANLRVQLEMQRRLRAGPQVCKRVSQCSVLLIGL
jgi:hypothetical protein